MSLSAPPTWKGTQKSFQETINPKYTHETYNQTECFPHNIHSRLDVTITFVLYKLFTSPNAAGIEKQNIKTTIKNCQSWAQTERRLPFHPSMFSWLQSHVEKNSQGNQIFKVLGCIWCTALQSCKLGTFALKIFTSWFLHRLMSRI